MYLIGIDFGHGETTASYIDTEKPYADEAKSILNVKKLNILDGDTPEKSKVESAICRDSQEGEWRFVRDCTDYKCPDFYVHFKAPMNEISQEKKNAFSAFVKLVFEHILKNQDFLHYDPETGEKNFCVFAACPSEWEDGSDGQIQKYKEFLNESIPVQWVIKESDAAYFKFKAQDRFSKSSALVIDIGSSTIDFTAYGESGLLSTEGKKHGASNVEIAIYNYYDQINDEHFVNARNEASILPNNNVWENGVKHYIKKSKEEFYRNELRHVGLDLHNKNFGSLLRERVFDCYEITPKKLEEDILVEYCKDLQFDMENVKKNTGTVDTVILTGGASRMPWVQLLVKDVFGESEVHRDTEPSYVVSDGIVSYAFAVNQFKQKYNDIIKNFWEKFSDEKLKDLIVKSFNEGLRCVRLPYIKELCLKFDEGSLVYESEDFKKLEMEYNTAYNGRKCTASFIPAMITSNLNIICVSKNDISKELDALTNKEINSTISNAIKEAFVDALHLQTPPEVDIKSSVNINLSNIYIESDVVVNRIKQLTADIYRKYLISGDIFKERDSNEERQKFTKLFYEKMKADVTLPDSILSDALTKLKNSINDELDEDVMLLKCIFKMY